MRQFATRRAALIAVIAVSLWAGASASNTPPRFPIRPSGDGRVLVDAGGHPFPILGRSSWFMALLSPADREHYVADSRTRGFNAMELLLIGHDPRGRHVPFNDAGAAPFLRRIDGAPWNGSLKYVAAAAETPDFTTPNETYWRDIDDMLARLNERGILAFAFPAYVGYAGNSDQGWMGEMVANGPARMRSYGEFIAKRYAHQPNIVWMLGGDFGELIRAIVVRRDDFTDHEAIFFTQDPCDFQAAGDFVVNLDLDDSSFQCNRHESLSSRSRNL